VTDSDSEEHISTIPAKKYQRVAPRPITRSRGDSTSYKRTAEESEKHDDLQGGQRRLAAITTRNGHLSQKQKGKLPMKHRSEEEQSASSGSEVISDAETSFPRALESAINKSHKRAMAEADGSDVAKVAEMSKKERPGSSRRLIKADQHARRVDDEPPLRNKRSHTTTYARRRLVKHPDAETSTASATLSRSPSVEIIESSTTTQSKKAKNVPERSPSSPAWDVLYEQPSFCFPDFDTRPGQSSSGRSETASLTVKGKKSKPGPGRHSEGFQGNFSESRPQTVVPLKGKGKARAMVIESDEESEGNVASSRAQDTAHARFSGSMRQQRNVRAEQRSEDGDSPGDRWREAELAKRKRLQEKPLPRQREIKKRVSSTRAAPSSEEEPIVTSSKKIKSQIASGSSSSHTAEDRAPNTNDVRAPLSDFVPTGLLDTILSSTTSPLEQGPIEETARAKVSKLYKSARHSGLFLESDEEAGSPRNKLFLDSPSDTPPVGAAKVSASKVDGLSSVAASKPTKASQSASPAPLPLQKSATPQPKIPAHRNKVARVQMFDTIPITDGIATKARIAQLGRRPSAAQAPAPTASTCPVGAAAGEPEVVAETVSPSPPPQSLGGDFDPSPRVKTPPPPSAGPSGEVSILDGDGVLPSVTAERNPASSQRRPTFEAALPAHRIQAVQPRVRPLEYSFTGMNEPAGRGNTTKQRIVSSLSKPRRIDFGALNGKAKGVAASKGHRMPPAMRGKTIANGVHASAPRAAIVPQPSAISVSSNNVHVDDHIEIQSDRDDDMESLFGGDDPIDLTQDDHAQVSDPEHNVQSSPKPPTGDDILKAHGVSEDVHNDLPDFEDGDGLEVIGREEPSSAP
jgi:hypothetical protein